MKFLDTQSANSKILNSRGTTQRFNNSVMSVILDTFRYFLFSQHFLLSNRKIPKICYAEKRNVHIVSNSICSHICVAYTRYPRKKYFVEIKLFYLLMNYFNLLLFKIHQKIILIFSMSVIIVYFYKLSQFHFPVIIE